MIIYLAAMALAAVLLACALRRDLQRAVARQRFEDQFAQIRSQWVAFQRAISEALLPSMREAAAAAHRVVFAAMDGGRR